MSGAKRMVGERGISVKQTFANAPGLPMRSISIIDRKLQAVKVGQAELERIYEASVGEIQGTINGPSTFTGVQDQ